MEQSSTSVRILRKVLSGKPGLLRPTTMACCIAPWCTQSHCCLQQSCGLTTPHASILAPTNDSACAGCHMLAKVSHVAAIVARVVHGGELSFQAEALERAATLVSMAAHKEARIAGQKQRDVANGFHMYAKDQLLLPQFNSWPERFDSHCAAAGAIGARTGAALAPLSPPTQRGQNLSAVQANMPTCATEASAPPPQHSA